jgi:hypothetical protein
MKSVKKKTSEVRVNDICLTGEIVLNTERLSYKQLQVTLKNPKTNNVRVSLWNYHGTVVMKDTNV